MHDDQRASGDLLIEISGTLRDCRKALQQLVTYLSKQAQPAGSDPRSGAFLKVEQAAAYLNVNPKTIRRATGDIKCPLRHVRVGSLLRFRREWLDEWLVRQTKGER